MIESSGKKVVLDWRCPWPDAEFFVIRWAKADKRFWPVDEISLKQARRLAKEEGHFRYRETLPTSGVSYYKVHACRVVGDCLVDESDDSTTVKVGIDGPAAGDP